MRKSVPSLAAASLSLFISGAHLAVAQVFPTKNVRIVVPFPPGGTSDFLSRMLAQRLTPMWGQQVIVENRPGASNIIGSDSVAKAAADGHALLMAFGTHSSNVCLYSKLPYDTLRDFEPVTNVAVGPSVVIVHPSLPVRSVKELIALAKARPGELNFASAGNGSPQHLAGELFNSMAGVKIGHVPYKGGVPALHDALGGHVPVLFASVLPVIPHIRAGKLRALAVTTLQRTNALPGVPTLNELGLAGYDSNSWFGLLTTGGTPKETIRKLNTDIIKVINTPEMRESLISQGVDPIADTPEQFAQFIKIEIEKSCKLIKALGIKAD